MADLYPRPSDLSAASMWCLACGHELASELIEYVPQDVRAAAYERRGGKIVEVPL